MVDDLPAPEGLGDGVAVAVFRAAGPVVGRVVVLVAELAADLAVGVVLLLGEGQRFVAVGSSGHVEVVALHLERACLDMAKIRRRLLRVADAMVVAEAGPNRHKLAVGRAAGSGAADAASELHRMVACPASAVAASEVAEAWVASVASVAAGMAAVGMAVEVEALLVAVGIVAVLPAAELLAVG